MNKVITMQGTEVGEATAAVMADTVLTVLDVARELRCSKAHVYNAINGKVSGVSALRVIHMGRRVLVRRSAFENWKLENERCTE